jgi:hypothetical protein
MLTVEQTSEANDNKNRDSIEIRKIGNNDYVLRVEEQPFPTYWKLYYDSDGKLRKEQIVKVYRDTILKARERCSLTELYKLCTDLQGNV